MSDFAVSLTTEGDNGSGNLESYRTPTKEKSSPFSRGGLQQSFSSPREMELSNTLSNLKLGFKQREEQLQMQLEIHKEAIYELYGLNLKLRSYLNAAGSTVCDQVEATEDLTEHTSVHSKAVERLQSTNEELQEECNRLADERERLVAMNKELKAQLGELQFLVGEGLPVGDGSVGDRERSNKELAQSSPTSIIEDAAAFADEDQPLSHSGRPSPAAHRSTAEGARRRHSSDNGAGNSSNSTSGRQRKPAVPTRDELRAAALTSPSSGRRSYPATDSSVSPKRSPFRRVSSPLPSSSSGNGASRGDAGSTGAKQTTSGTSGDTDNAEPAASPSKPPRVSLRKRIEDLSKQSRENNPWLGAFSTTNRSSSGGCQFYVDVPSPRSPQRRVEGYEDYDLTMSGSDSRRSTLGTESGAEAQRALPDGAPAGGDVVLLKVDSTDLLNLSNCSQQGTEALAVPSDLSSGEAAGLVVSGDSTPAAAPGSSLMGIAADSDAAASLEEQLAIYQAQVAALEAQVQELQSNAQAAVIGPAVIGGRPSRYNPDLAVSEDSVDAPACLSQGLESPALAYPALSLADSIRHDEDDSQLFSPPDFHHHEVTELQLSEAEEPQGGAVGNPDSLAVVQLRDSETQCDSLAPPVAPNMAEVSCNTDTDWLENALAIAAGATSRSAEDGAPSALIINTRAVEANAALIKAIDDTKFALGKRLFELRHGSRKTAPIAPPTPLGVKKATSVALKGSAPSAAPPAATVTSGLSSPGKPAVPQAGAHDSVLAKLNAELLTKLEAQTTLAERGRRKVALLEQKLVRLIMYVKQSARQAAEAERSVALAAGSVSPRGQTAPAGSNGEARPVPQADPAPALARAQNARPVVGTPVIRADQEVDASLNVGCMTGGKDLDHLLNLGDDEDEHSPRSPGSSASAPLSPLRPATTPARAPPQTQRAVNDTARSLFSPGKDFQGRNYDDLPEVNVSIQSNPLHHHRRSKPETPGPERSRLDLSFHAERSFMDTPEMASPAGIQIRLHTATGNYSPIPIASATAVKPPPNGATAAPLPSQHPQAPQARAPQRAAAIIGGGRPASANRSILRSVTAQVKPQLPPTNDAGPGSSSPLRSPPQSPKRQLFPPGQAPAGQASPAPGPGSPQRIVSAPTALAQARHEIQRLQQQMGHLTHRNKNLTREKELLTAKLQNVLESDTPSFNLQIYTSNEEISLHNPTKTMSLVLGLLEHNNKQQDEIAALKAQLEGKTRQLESHARQAHELRDALATAEKNSRYLGAELDSVRQASGAAEQERQLLRRQVGEMTYSVVHLTQENRLLKERMRLYQY